MLGISVNCPNRKKFVKINVIHGAYTKWEKKAVKNIAKMSFY